MVTIVHKIPVINMAQHAEHMLCQSRYHKFMRPYGDTRTVDNLPFSANLGALYRPLILYTLQASAQCKDGNALKYTPQIFVKPSDCHCV